MRPWFAERWRGALTSRASQGRAWPALRDPRFWLLLAALALAVWAATGPGITRRHARLDLLVVIDVTGSMNVRDMPWGGKPIGRLDYVRRRLTEVLAALPCGSRLGLGIFTERRPFLLFEPVETCSGYDPLAQTLGALDWRMAWEGDSRIADGLYRSIALAGQLNTGLVFITDGHEAPPLPAAGRPPFDGELGKVKGLLVGVGGDVPAPIPKFSDAGREVGFYAANEVDQENRSGLPPTGSELREGWDARNAPFGGKAAVGNEHLSSLRESYLQTLGRATGLGYARLGTAQDLLPALQANAPTRGIASRQDLRPPLALAALACLVLAWLAAPLGAMFTRLRRLFPVGMKEF